MKKDKGKKHKVVSISMNEEEYKFFKKSKDYISKEFLEQEISNSKFLKYILYDFYHDLNVMKNTNEDAIAILKNNKGEFVSYIYEEDKEFFDADLEMSDYYVERLK